MEGTAANGGGSGKNSVTSYEKGEQGVTTRALTRFVMGKHSLGPGEARGGADGDGGADRTRRKWRRLRSG